MQGKVLLLLPLFLALGSCQINAFYNNTAPILLTPGVLATTGFVDYLGSQFYIWVPFNVSAININWVRSVADANCYSSAYAFLYGKWGTWPCSSSAYDLSYPPCEESYTSFGYSANSPQTYTMNAYDGLDVEYWTDGFSGNDFITGDYLYLASYLDTDTQCTASINITFEYCPSGQIAVEGYPGSSCLTYNNVTANPYSTSKTANGPFTHPYVITVPQNHSGVAVTFSNTNGNDFYIYGRYSTGGSDSNYENYFESYTQGDSRYFFPAVGPEGSHFVVTVTTSDTGANIAYSISISNQHCPAGFAPDEYGTCDYSANYVSMADLAQAATYTVPITNSTGDCNWKFVVAMVPAYTYAFVNLTMTEIAGSNGQVYIRKNAPPTENFYDIWNDVTFVVNFTPEDFYTGQPTTWWVGFCNDGTADSAQWSISASVHSAGPVGSSPSPSPGHGHTGGMGSAASVVASSMLLVTLAVLGLVF